MGIVFLISKNSICEKKSIFFYFYSGTISINQSVETKYHFYPYPLRFRRLRLNIFGKPKIDENVLKLELKILLNVIIRAVTFVAKVNQNLKFVQGMELSIFIKKPRR